MTLRSTFWADLRQPWKLQGNSQPWSHHGSVKASSHTTHTDKHSGRNIQERQHTSEEMSPKCRERNTGGGIGYVQGRSHRSAGMGYKQGTMSPKCEDHCCICCGWGGGGATCGCGRGSIGTARQRWSLNIHTCYSILFCNLPRWRVPWTTNDFSTPIVRMSKCMHLTFLAGSS